MRQIFLQLWLDLIFVLISCHCKVSLYPHKLSKRLNDVSHAMDSLNDLCDYNINNGSIIRTNDSITAGATFLRYMKHVTRDECINHCCYTQGCSAAIYEERVDHDCYLFNCLYPVSVCKFAPHEGYLSLMFAEHVPSTPAKSDIEQHVNELEGLELLGSKGQETYQKPSTTTLATTTTVRTTTTTRQPVYLFAPCDELDICADPHAECQSGSCDCQEGFKAKYGKCRNKSHGKALVHSGKTKPSDNADKSNGRDDKPQVNDAGDAKADTPSQDVQDASSGNDGNGHDMQQHQQQQQAQQQPPAEEGDTNIPDDTEEENLDEDYYENHGEIIPGANEPSEPVAKFNGGIDTKQNDNNEAEGPEQPDDTIPEKKDHSPSLPDEHSDASYHVKKVVVSSPTDSAQGPIIALAIGLAITLILLVGVVCRLRTVKRRIRRGKLLHSHEADYLINGMYL